ncbi:hypothetical protein GQ43DRAFT_440979 [Delitschia confertaspora ATCC 74209]|uniref:Uncharacterized protein n=1 Tax=Delitschia confertaspora ATCC 74209 TaxID=1513339 RepID=A0A9P4MYM2_9PLEO|nr:hypothetical protein GQ43DRAFT_440979 [Delitschia confertaspora ATCC 74209]
MPSISSVLLVIQGLPIAGFGATILADQAKAGFADIPASVAHVIGFSSLSLSAVYLATAFQASRSRHHFLLTTIPLRLAAAYAFWRDGADARGAPLWDVINALISVGVLLYERTA